MTAADHASPLVLPRVPEGLARILLRLPNWLGDVVMAAPTVAAIHGARPDAVLVAQVAAPFMPLARLLPGVREVVPAAGDRSSGDRRRSAEMLRALQLDAAVLFPRSLRASLAPHKARIGVRVGFGGPGRRLTHAVRGWQAWRREHRSRWFGLLAHAFGAEIGGPWTLEVPPAARARAVGLLRALGRDEQKPLVVLEPGASYGQAKCWPAARFGALAARLRSDGCDVVTVGTDATKAVEARVARAAGGGLLRAAGHTPDLGALLGVLAEAALVVSNDTGPMHVAAAVGTPVLALFGATDPVISAPIGVGPRSLVFDPEPCSPCFLRTCPVPGHPCLSKLGVAAVTRAARVMLHAHAD